MIEKKRPAKGETLTIRLDTKSRFMLDFVARAKGQTMTTVVERALTDAADNVRVCLDNDIPPGDLPDDGSYVNWRYFWNSIPGIRELAIADVDDLYPTYEEKHRLEFAKRFWPFFYTDRNCTSFNVDFIDALWNKIDYFISVHEGQKQMDFYAVTKIMSSCLEGAGLTPPEWPPAPEPTF